MAKILSYNRSYQKNKGGEMKKLTKEEFIKNQNANPPVFIFRDGKCWSWKCKADVIEEEIKRGNDGTRRVTGCPVCYRSFCD